jgi:Dyp-type peroxidase family
MSSPSNNLVDWPDMQGLILSAYPHLGEATYLLYQIDDAREARQWLAGVIDHVTPAMRHTHSNTRVNVNVALSHTGLAKLCDLGGEADAGFSCAYREGIAGRVHRSRILGDTGLSAPANWRWGGRQYPVDLLLMVFFQTGDWASNIPATAQPPRAALSLVKELRALSRSKTGDAEHFGFKDGMSQPILTGTIDAERYPESQHLTALGEIVFGYPDGIDQIAWGPALRGYPDFGRNGTYLVCRQLHQHVAAFWNAVSQKTSAGGTVDCAAARLLASKIVGRSQDGTPLVPGGNPANNEYNFTDDRYGYGCPLGAHTRRSNPRNSIEDSGGTAIAANRHRVLRRGRSYGDKLSDLTRDDGACLARDNGARRGLVFMCLNADIERQFEFINQNWVNNSGFMGLADERDPLVGDHSVTVDGCTRFTIPGLPAPSRVQGLPRFITVEGGEYFFLPGIRALKHLAGV